MSNCKNCFYYHGSYCAKFDKEEFDDHWKYDDCKEYEPEEEE